MMEEGRVDFGRTCGERILSPVVLWLPCCIPDTTCLVLKGDIVLFSQSLSSLNIDKLVLWKILLIGNVGIKLRPRGSFDNFLLNALIEVSEYANKLLMFSLILWPQLSYLFPQMRDSLIENAVHEPHQVTKLGWPVANFLAYACFLLSLYPLYLAPYFFSFEPSSTCLTFQLFGHVHNLQGSNFTLMARDNKSIKDAFLWEQHFFLSEMYFSQWSYLDGIAAFASSGENWRRERFFFYKFKTIWSILLIPSVKMGRWLTLNWHPNILGKYCQKSVVNGERKDMLRPF